MKEIKISQNMIAFVDDEDFESASKFKWSLARSRHKLYARRNIKFTEDGVRKQKQIYLHRFIMKANGSEILDHKNGNGLDNRKENLRFCTQQQNLRNKLSKNQKNGEFRGGVFF